MAGEVPSLGEKLVAAIVNRHPDFSKAGSRRLPNSLRCIRGWRRLCPPKSRVPEASPVCACEDSDGHLDPAGARVLPPTYEVHEVETQGFGGAEPPLQKPMGRAAWGVRGQTRTKTGDADVGVVWDCKNLEWMRKVFALLKAPGRSDEPSFRLTHQEPPTS
jgi:hypothetical protein